MKCLKDDIALGELTLGQLHEIFLKVKRYCRFGFKYPDPVVAEIEVRTESEGEDYYLKAYSHLERSREGKSIWKIGLGFDPTHDDDFDHTSRELVGGERERQQRLELVKFKLARFYPGRQSKEKLELAYSDICYLDNLFTKLDKETASLYAWAKSGHPMAVICQRWMCNSGYISNEALVAYSGKGLSLADLKARFRCSQCGQREPLLLPTRAG